MSNGTMIIKRDGSKEHLNIDKIHKVVMHACEGLAGRKCKFNRNECQHTIL